MAVHCVLCVAKGKHGFIIRVQGRGTSNDSPTLANFVRDCFSMDNTSVAVDLLGCTYLDSTFLGCLLTLQRQGKEERFCVVADEATRTRLLAATGLDGYLKLISKAPRSLSPFLKIEPTPVSERELGQHIMEAHQALSEVPSEVASAFREIASKLKDELAKQDSESPDLLDTVMMPVQKQK